MRLPILLDIADNLLVQRIHMGHFFCGKLTEQGRRLRAAFPTHPARQDGPLHLELHTPDLPGAGAGPSASFGPTIDAVSNIVTGLSNFIV